MRDAVVALTGLPVPFPEAGAFKIFGWQIPWLLGLWPGASRASGAEPHNPGFLRSVDRLADAVLRSRPP